jgi:hypothetical protein
VGLLPRTEEEKAAWPNTSWKDRLKSKT